MGARATFIAEPLTTTRKALSITVEPDANRGGLKAFLDTHAMETWPLVPADESPSHLFSVRVSRPAAARLAVDIAEGNASLARRTAPARCDAAE